MIRVSVLCLPPVLRGPHAYRLGRNSSYLETSCKPLFFRLAEMLQTHAIRGFDFTAGAFRSNRQPKCQTAYAAWLSPGQHPESTAMVDDEISCSRLAASTPSCAARTGVLALAAENHQCRDANEFRIWVHDQHPCLSHQDRAMFLREASAREPVFGPQNTPGFARP
jgi:hypothetical protein